MAENVGSVLSKVLKLGALLTLAIATLGSAAGYLVAGLPGVWAALVGSSASFAFMALTTLSVSIGSRLGTGGLMGLVLGGWLVKMLLFMVLFAYLNQAEWLSNQARPIVFFTVVAAVLGGLALDGWVVAKSRLSPTV